MNRVVRFAVAALCLSACLPTGTAASDCAQRCYAEENACRRKTQDSPSCGSQLTRCLQSCRAQR